MTSSCPLPSTVMAPRVNTAPLRIHASTSRDYPSVTPSIRSQGSSRISSSLQAHPTESTSKCSRLHRGNPKNRRSAKAASRRVSHGASPALSAFGPTQAAASGDSGRSNRVRAAASGDVAAAAAASVAEASLDERVEIASLRGRAREEAEAVQAAVFQAAQELDAVAAENAVAAGGVAAGDGGAEGQGSGGSADGRARMARLLQWARELQGESPSARGGSSASPALRTRENRVMGCVAQVWLHVDLEEDTSAGDADLSRFKLRLQADSDSDLTRGICQLLLKTLDGRSVSAALALDSNGPAVKALSAALKPAATSAASPAKSPPVVRTSTFVSLLLSLQKRARALAAAALGRTPSVDPLPSIVIGRGGKITARGDFAVAQAQYLLPDESAVASLVKELSSKRIGIVAHFYMDAEVQGVLVAARKSWPHIKISDSLVMADGALKMVQDGCDSIAVLGVDFMAENVRCVLEKGGFGHVPVVRMAATAIGCSLADAARSDAYGTFLKEAAAVPKSLHVIYINTALDTKAWAHHTVPTISCTSSNVVQTVLQAFAQVPDLTLWYGPDTYMGANLVEMLRQLSALPDEEVRTLHPDHTQASLLALLPRLRYFQEGACIVHDMFGQDVVSRLRAAYSDAFHTAHFEVPGEMFALAMEARARGRGTVGSTQNILDFVTARTRDALERGYEGERLQFVLGTETGMVTSIVQAVQDELAKAENAAAAGAAAAVADVEVEIVFPVDSSAVASTKEDAGRSTGSSSGSSSGSGGGGVNGKPAGLVAAEMLPVVPGVKGGEGCSVTGGCASCPYMKMNSLHALMEVCRMLGQEDSLSLLAPYEPDKFAEPLGPGTVADLGYLPILHMRHFQKTGRLSEELVADIMSRNQSRQ